MSDDFDRRLKSLNNMIDKTNRIDRTLSPLTPHDAPRWIVAAAHPNKEMVAQENLIRQNFTVYCPVIVKRVRHARRAYDAARPLFPGYLFVQTASAKNFWRPITGTLGIRSVILRGDQPATLPEGFVEALKAREVEGVIARPETPFTIGQDVAINAGPFDGLIGKVVEIRETDRIVLLLRLLNQETKTQILSTMLRPVQDGDGR